MNALFAYTVGKREMNRIIFGYQIKEAEFKSDEQQNIHIKGRLLVLISGFSGIVIH